MNRNDKSTLRDIMKLEKNPVHYHWDSIRHAFVPGEEGIDDYSLPDGIATDFSKLNAFIESKYSREFIKTCLFYNKLFPSLKSYDYEVSTYNTIPFAVTDQEASDTGTGISSNYLKVVIDTVVSRVGFVDFEVRIQSEEPVMLLEMYKRQIERYLKNQIRENKLSRMVTECFHDAAILNFAHIWIDPWTGVPKKLSDWEVGYYEPEFIENKLRRCMVRYFSFPVGELGPYVEGIKPDELKRIIEGKCEVDLQLYIDCFRHEKVVTIDNSTGSPTPYPFDHVLLTSYGWDMGVKRTLVTSLFDLLLPLQRQINKFNAKRTVMCMNYKGPVPIISTNGDIDEVMRSLNNQSGEILFLDAGQRNPSELVGTINPTPLDPQLSAEISAYKAEMFELAGVQEISMDVENYRSAAAVIALDQMRDVRFQGQLSSIAQLVNDVLIMVIKWNAMLHRNDEDPNTIPWDDFLKLLKVARIDITPVHTNVADEKPDDPPDNYQIISVDRFIIRCLKGVSTYADIDYTINRDVLRKQAVNKLLVFKTLDADSAEKLEQLVLDLFIDDIKNGMVDLSGEANG